MIEDGVLENPKVDTIFGYHNSTKSDFGCLFASQDVFTVVIHGKGGHGAYPHLTVDPIYIGSLIIQALQGIVSRCSAPV